ncbi:hypothetical protein H9L15_15445 [Sphingomonas daechungensis]|uniref:Uncharacterized protein n=1 Tax=Sphingomonas daechungensis TaxID=1176646 RepID=A0ABX6T1J3_9SPHN|nr:hypothetical protein [Sphingomonas daechungensis]QNP43274.1 hypothetical protein H9L15_15445 [Sphingomonas daechungensis]
MSRPESKFTAAGLAGLDAAELVAAFGAQSGRTCDDRTLAIARLLAASPGWAEARDRVGGAFAEAASEEESKDVKGREGEINQRVSEYLQGARLKTNAIDND